MALSRSARLRQEASERRKLEDLKRCGTDPFLNHPDLYDYAQAGQILGLAPRTVEYLCDQRKLGYILRTWRYGVYRRQKRLIPKFALLEYLMTSGRYKPPKAQHTSRKR